MIPVLEMRNFMYSTGAAIIACVLCLVMNMILVRKKRELLGAPVLFVIKKVSPLADKHKILKPFASKTFWATLEMILFTVFEIVIQPLINRNFGILVGTDGNFFGLTYFAPFIFGTIFLMFWQNPLKNMDLFAFTIPLMLTSNKIGCFFAGCCNGVWWPGGLYNYHVESRREEVPIQLVEAACAVIVFIFIVVYNNKNKKRKDGDLYPIFVILFSGLRFISEFWRDDKLVWLNFRYYHLFCAIGVVYGIIMLLLVNKYSDKFNIYFNNTVYFSRKLKEKRFRKYND